jgi:hypothetical protein
MEYEKFRDFISDSEDMSALVDSPIELAIIIQGISPDNK